MDGAVEEKGVGDPLVQSVVPYVDPIGGACIHHGKELLGNQGRQGGHAVINLNGVHSDVHVSGDLDILPVQEARGGFCIVQTGEK